MPVSARYNLTAFLLRRPHFGRLQLLRESSITPPHFIYTKQCYVLLFAYILKRTTRLPNSPIDGHPSHPIMSHRYAIFA